MNSIPLFALMTDFGFDFSVATLKVLLIQAFPACRIIDLDHSIRKFSVCSGAFVLANTYRYFPQGTIFIAVVDPGVGSQRTSLVVQYQGYYFVGPNNGLFHYIVQQPDAQVYRIDDAHLPKSNTFHGRDVFVPIAIALASGDFSLLKPVSRSSVVLLDVLEKETVVTYIDSFGNIKTNFFLEETLPPQGFAQITLQKKKFSVACARTFSDVPQGQLCCYKGSNNTLEIALHGGSAGAYLQITEGTPLMLHLEKGGACS